MKHLKLGIWLRQQQFSTVKNRTRRECAISKNITMRQVMVFLLLLLLFWLGWGLVAFTSTPWFAVGATYGVLLWFATALPALTLLALRVPALRVACVVLAIEALGADGE